MFLTTQEFTEKYSHLRSTSGLSAPRFTLALKKSIQNHYFEHSFTPQELRRRSDAKSFCNSSFSPLNQTVSISSRSNVSVTLRFPSTFIELSKARTNSNPRNFQIPNLLRGLPNSIKRFYMPCLNDFWVFTKASLEFPRSSTCLRN